VATIAVEIPVVHATPERTEALLRACAIAAAPDQCQIADASSETPAAFAIVTWQGELIAHIEIGRQGSRDWLERRLTFAEEDPPLERWQAVGYAIGTLYGAARDDALQEGPAQPSPSPAPTPPEPAAPPPSAHREAAAHTVQLAGLGRVGTGTESSARFGAALALSARHAAGPFVGADASFDLSEASFEAPAATLSTRYVTVAASIGTALTLSRKLRLDLSAGPLVEYQWLWTNQSSLVQSRLVGGVRANLALAHRLGPRVWVGIGAQMGSRFGDTTIAVDAERVDSVPLIFATLTASVAIDLWLSHD